MDTTGLHGVTGSVQAGTVPAKPQSSGGGVLGTGIPNIFDPSFWGAFGTSQSREGKRAGLPGAAGSAVEGGQSVAKTIGNPGSWLAGVAELITSYGLRLLQVLAGAALVLFGLATLGKGDTPRLGPVG